jgi:hypothetical protein
MEGDNEVSGEGNSYTAEYWQYDSRLGRRWNVDPVPQVSMSDYSVNGNNPNVFVDPIGAFKTKFGAWLYSKTHGGGDVQKYHDHEGVEGDIGEKAIKSGHKYFVSGKGSGGFISTNGQSENTDGSQNLDEVNTQKGKPIIDWGGNTYSERARQEAIDDYKIDFQIRQTFPQHSYPELYTSNGQGTWWYESKTDRNMAWASNLAFTALPNPFLKVFSSSTSYSRLTSQAKRAVPQNLSPQKQVSHGHIFNTSGNQKIYLNTLSDAQEVINAVHNNQTRIMGIVRSSKDTRVYVRYNGVSGTWIKNGESKTTNIFYIVGEKSAKVVPVHPNY